MQAFGRTTMTSGVALIGASAIALSPIVVSPQQVHLPSVPVSSFATTLTASVNPINEWAQVLTTTFNNIADLGQQVWADPAPILKQILINQLGYANTTVSALSTAGSSLVTALQALPPAFGQAGQQLAAGDISGGINTAYQAVVSLVLQPGLALLTSGVLDIPGKIAQNITNVVKLAPGILIGVGFSALATAFSVESAFGDTAQAVYNGVRAGNLGAALNAIVNAPAVLTNAFLNGYNTAAGAWGILTPGNGLVSTLVVGVRDAIAQALGAPVPAAAASPAPVAAKVADAGPSAVPSAALSAATVALGAGKVTTPDSAKTAATKTTATEPAAAAPAAAEPAATSPETPSPATETKPESGTTSGSATTPNGGTTTPNGGTTGSTKAGTPGTTGEPTKPTKPSGSAGSQTGSGNTTTQTGGTSTSTTSGTTTGTPGKTGEPKKPTKPTKPSGSTGSGTGSGSTGSGSGGASGGGASTSGGGASHAAA